MSDIEEWAAFMGDSYEIVENADGSTSYIITADGDDEFADFGFVASESDDDDGESLE